MPQLQGRATSALERRFFRACARNGDLLCVVVREPRSTEEKLMAAHGRRGLQRNHDFPLVYARVHELELHVLTKRSTKRYGGLATRY